MFTLAADMSTLHSNAFTLRANVLSFGPFPPLCVQPGLTTPPRGRPQRGGSGAGFGVEVRRGSQGGGGWRECWMDRWLLGRHSRVTVPVGPS